MLGSEANIQTGTSSHDSSEDISLAEIRHVSFGVVDTIDVRCIPYKATEDTLED
jgi:hypothetical protein